ncbi:MAG: transposase [Candidatus Baldrarchaeia archaeon]
MGNGGRSKGRGKPRPPGRRLNRNPHRRKGLHFKVHFLYDVRFDLVMAATATPGPTADYQGYRKLLHSVPEKSVVLADSAYFGRSNFEKTLERDALLLAKPRRPPRRGRRWG